METILIQNFKAIKNTAKREIKVANLTILMGEQATGKSTVAKLVYFFKKLPEQIYTEILTNKAINDKNFDSVILDSITSIFIQLFGSANNMNEFNVSYFYNNHFRVAIRKGNKRVKLVIDSSNKEPSFGLKSQLLHLGMKVHHIRDNYMLSERIELDRLSEMIIYITNIKFSNNQNIMYVPASRNISVSFEPHLLDIFSTIQSSINKHNSVYSSENDLVISEFLRHTQRIKNRFKSGSFKNLINDQIHSETNLVLLQEAMTQAISLLRGEYINGDKFGEKIILQDGSAIELSNSSSGQQEIIRILQDIFIGILEDEPVFRVYEEPESHLSPVGQLGIIQLIAMLANRNPDNQIIIPTHTPYLLQEVGNMMKASEIASKNPELKEEISKILKPFYWLDLSSVSAYQLNRDGEIEDAKDAEYHMIDGELFDKVTNDIGSQFDELLKLQHER